jgi:hypothetical protein
MRVHDAPFRGVQVAALAGGVRASCRRGCDIHATLACHAWCSVLDAVAYIPFLTLRFSPAGGCFAFGYGQAVALRQSPSGRILLLRRDEIKVRLIQE